MVIGEILNNLKIPFKKEYTFSDLRNPETNYPLRFDFMIKDINDKIYLIEYNGIQHYIYNDRHWGKNKEEWEKSIYRDKQKEIYCDKNQIVLITIPYYDINKIDNNYIKNKLLERGFEFG